MRRKKPPRRAPRPRIRSDVQTLCDETFALFHWLAWVSDRIYGDDAPSAAQRWVLRALARGGAQTVPALARARAARRQSLQPVVDALAAEGLVELAANAAHVRSPLVALSRRGSALVDRMDAVDARVLRAVSRGIASSELAKAATTLRALRAGFELEARWRAAITSTA